MSLNHRRKKYIFAQSLLGKQYDSKRGGRNNDLKQKELNFTSNFKQKLSRFAVTNFVSP